MRVNRRVVLVVASAVLTGSLILSGCGKKDNAKATQAPPPPEVGVVTIKPQTITITTELAGRTSPYLIAEVRPQVGGIIQKRLFTEGSDVKVGAMLYQIDPATYQAAYESAKAALAKADANVAVARARADRYTSLVSINAVSRQDYDNAVAALKQAEADVASGKAAVDSARINLNYTRVTSPISGRIGKSDVTPGALVTGNQPGSLATVQQLDPIYVDVTQSSLDLLRLKRELASKQLESSGATKVKLVLEDGTPYPLEGRLQFSDVTVDKSTGSVTIRAVFPNPKDVLLPGMYVRAILEEGQSSNAIVVPQQGVTRDSKGNATVLVVAPDGSANVRKIKTNRTLGDKWLVSEGLQAGDQVIVDGLQRVRIVPNQPAPKVTPKEVGAPPAATAQQSPPAAQSAPAASTK